MSGVFVKVSDGTPFSFLILVGEDSTVKSETAAAMITALALGLRFVISLCISSAEATLMTSMFRTTSRASSRFTVETSVTSAPSRVATSASA